MRAISPVESDYFQKILAYFVSFQAFDFVAKSVFLKAESRARTV